MTTDNAETLQPPMRSPDARPSIVLRVFRSLAVSGLGLLGFGLAWLGAMDLAGPGKTKDLGLIAFVIAAGLVYMAVAVRLARPVRALWKLRLAVGLGWALILSMLFVLIAPDLFRARVSYNESHTIADLQALVASPGTASAGLPQPTLYGYTRTLHLPAADATASPSHSFAVTAAALEPGSSGVRGFCADTTGVVCFSVDGTDPPVRSDGTCDLDVCNRMDWASRHPPR